MAASTDGAMKADEDAVLSTLPELSILPSDHDVGSFAAACPKANETVSCNAQSSAASSPKVMHSEQKPQLLDQEVANCNGVASIPIIPAELEPNLTLRTTDMSIPPTVDSVTNNMLKVCINQALNCTEESLPHYSLSNAECGPFEQHEISTVIPQNGDDERDVSLPKADFEPKPLSNNGHATIVKADARSLQMNNCVVAIESIEDGKSRSLVNDGSKLGTDKNDDGGDCNNDDDDDDHDDDDDEEEEEEGKEEEEEEADNSSIDIDDDSNSGVEQDSESSSSTSSLSFLSSDDGDDADSLQCFLNGANNQNDLAMQLESECEEGEFKESPSRRKKGSLNKKTINMSSEDEEILKKPARSKNKTKDLPYVPKVSLTLEEYHKTVPVGYVSSVVGVSLIVEGIEGQQPLNEGSILWLTDQRLPLGIVDELFGPVKKPFYVVRYNDVTEMPELAKEGMQVSYVREFAEFVLNNPDLYSKGYDESGREDNSDSEVNFSDDEKEAEYKRSKFRVKRANSETNSLEADYRQHQEKQADSKHLNKDKKHWRSRGENARTFQFDHEFSGRPAKPRNARFQHHRNDREPPFADRLERTSDEQNKHWHGNRSPVHKTPSRQSLGVGQLKPWTPKRSTSGSSIPSGSQEQPLKMNQSQSISLPNVQEPILINHTCSTSQPMATNQQQAQPLQAHQPRSFTQPTSQQVQPLHMNQPHNLMNQPHGLIQSTVPQVVPWQAIQQQMSPPELSGIQQSQMPVYGQTVVAGQVSQVAIGGYDRPLGNKLPLQPGTNTVQFVPPAYESPVYQQESPPALSQCSSMSHHFSGQGSQGLPNMGMPMGNQIQSVPANGYPVGVQPADLAAPVLGIPASTLFNYPTQTVCNQSVSGFTPAVAHQSSPSMYRVPEQARTIQPMAAASWQQQQHVPEDSSHLWPPQPFHHRSQQMRGPNQGRRF